MLLKSLQSITSVRATYRAKLEIRGLLDLLDQPDQE